MVLLFISFGPEIRGIEFESSRVSVNLGETFNISDFHEDWSVEICIIGFLESSCEI